MDMTSIRSLARRLGLPLGLICALVVIVVCGVVLLAPSGSSDPASLPVVELGSTAALIEEIGPDQTSTSMDSTATSDSEHGSGVGTGAGSGAGAGVGTGHSPGAGAEAGAGGVGAGHATSTSPTDGSRSTTSSLEEDSTSETEAAGAGQGPRAEDQHGEREVVGGEVRVQQGQASGASGAGQGR